MGRVCETPRPMRRVASLGTLVVALWSGTSAAAGWRGYVSASTGFVIDHLTGVRARGGALQLYAGVETPFGLSLGVVGEGAETWGASIQGQQLELDYQSLGLEMRLRFLRDGGVNPWAGLRISQSRSTPLTLDAMGAPRRMLNSGLSAALRVGMDTWLNEYLGITVSTAWQWCDVRVDASDPAAGPSDCTKPLHSILGGPVVRF
jgi:type IV secretory pathway TrbD component